MLVKDEFLSRLRRYFNLNLYEVKIWTALLSRGVSTAGELSDIANVPRSRSYDVLESLEKKGFIKSVEKKGKKTKRTIEIVLKYQDKSPMILGLKRISKPGQRIYLDSGKIKKVKQGYGISIISTSKGLMTDSDARKNKLGGEVICEVW